MTPRRCLLPRLLQSLGTGFLLVVLGLLGGCTCGDSEHPAPEPIEQSNESHSGEGAPATRVVPDPAPQGAATFSLAASLRPVGSVLLDAFLAQQKANGQAPPRPVLNYGSTGILKRQIEAGAPVDAVLFAARGEAEDLASMGLLEQASLFAFARNEIVLASHQESEPLQWRTLSALGPGEHLAIGNPRYVPAGRYGRELLRRMHLWDSLQPHLLYASDVTAALSYVRRKEARGALVYATDIRAFPEVIASDRLSMEAGPKPELWAGRVLDQGVSPEIARSFLEFLRGEQAQKILREAGFKPL